MTEIGHMVTFKENKGLHAPDRPDSQSPLNPTETPNVYEYITYQGYRCRIHVSAQSTSSAKRRMISILREREEPDEKSTPDCKYKKITQAARYRGERVDENGGNATVE